MTAEKMKRLGIYTGADLKAQSLEFLEQYFGRSGTYYYAIARGHRRAPGGAEPAAQVGRLRDDLHGGSRPRRRRSRRACDSVLDDVWGYCERTGMSGRTVTLKIKYADFQIVTRSRTLSDPVSSREVLARTSIELVRTIFPLEKRVRLLGVALSNMAERADGPRPAPPQLTLGL